MARKSTHIDAPLEAAWQALADGWRYSDRVVGSRHVRDVDAGWPARGTKIHHTVGIGPLSWNDETEVLDVEAPRLSSMVMCVPPPRPASSSCTRAVPNGRRRASSRPVGGPLARRHNSVSELLLKGRNLESLRRLERVAESRASGRSRRRSGGGQGHKVGATP